MARLIFVSWRYRTTEGFGDLSYGSGERRGIGATPSFFVTSMFLSSFLIFLSPPPCSCCCCSFLPSFLNTLSRFNYVPLHHVLSYDFPSCCSFFLHSHFSSSNYVPFSHLLFSYIPHLQKYFFSPHTSASIFSARFSFSFSFSLIPTPSFPSSTSLPRCCGSYSFHKIWSPSRPPCTAPRLHMEGIIAARMRQTIAGWKDESKSMDVWGMVGKWVNGIEGRGGKVMDNY